MSTIYTFKQDSEIEKKVQQVEKLMQELGISIHHSYGGLYVGYNGEEYPIIDMESKDQVMDFPRQFEGQKIKARDS